ncbi:hypothetical protein G5B35_12240 [Parapusillimonas sp. SGNA-6]|nr:hypothetical protein [Parapusillimonas sp. SGNA-6]
MRAKNCRRFDKDELDISAWKYPDEGALPDGPVKKGYLARKKAISLYFEGATERQIRANAGIGLSQTLRLIKERCLSVHADGEVWGWRALVPWEHINPYQRKHRIVVDQFGMGAVGALNAVLNTHPGLREKLEKRILAGTSALHLSTIKRNKHSHWRWFLEQLRSLGYEVEEKWPFNTKSLAYVTICRYIDTVRQEHPEAGALAVGGPENKKKLLTGDGTERPIEHLFERVEMDAHKIDGRFSVLLPQPTGGYAQKLVHRLWVVVIIEVVSRCVLGYHLSMRKEVSKFDVLRALKMALTKWKKPSIMFGDEAYLPYANLPSGASEKFVGICWDQTSVDGALAETCPHVRQVLKDVVQSELIEPKKGFSIRRSKDDRPFIEVFFKKLGAHGFQRLSNTTGGKPQDKVGRKPDEIALASQFQIEYAKELLAVLVANYNATPHTSLGLRSPLEYLDFRAKNPDRALRYADPNSVSDMVSFRKLCTVHGGYQQGRRPFIYFAHGRYSSDTLGQRHDLVGQKIWVIVHIEDDCRLVRASTQSGQPLGLLHVSAPWNRLPHSLEVRTAIASYISAGKLRVAAGHDAVEVFMNYFEQQTNKKLPVHPAYLEARRTLTDVAEATMGGRSMLEISKERHTEHSIENSARAMQSQAPLHRSEHKLDAKRKLPAPRKAANN